MAIMTSGTPRSPRLGCTQARTRRPVAEEGGGEKRAAIFFFQELSSFFFAIFIVASFRTILMDDLLFPFKGYYRRMGSMKQHLGSNAMSAITFLHYQLRDVWRSPRGTVLRIEALALVAIGFSFFLASYGSCRRWSNRWIIQKGFLIAQVLSLSLGTYSIGLMQSSLVKSEMYPIWAVSLLTLFGCIDPISTYNGLDYKGPLSKMIFQLCIYTGYVLLMSTSTISSDVGKVAIGVLSAITLARGFHRSLAFVLPGRTREDIRNLVPTEPAALVVGEEEDGGEGLSVHLLSYLHERWGTGEEDMLISMSSIHKHISKLQLKPISGSGDMTIEDVCLGYSLSHLLQRRFLGFDTAREMDRKRERFESLVRDGNKVIDYKRTLKAIEVELAFLYEAYFTSNEFLHLYQARTASFWAFASFIGICFLGVVVAIPGTMASHHRTAGAGTTVVYTTTADLVITLFILVSLALLQLLQLIRCWTSNWARVAFAYEYTRSKMKDETSLAASRGWWMRMRAFVLTRINWFDKYLWQDKLGQHSLVESWTTPSLALNVICCLCCPCLMCGGLCIGLCINQILRQANSLPLRLLWICERLARMLGLHYVWQVLDEVLLISDATNQAAGSRAADRLHDDVKAHVAEFLGQMKSARIGADWAPVFIASGLDDCFDHLPYNTTAPLRLDGETMSDAYAFTHRLMAWHLATSYCQLVEKEGGGAAGGGGDDDRNKNRRVAIALSRYCAYLVASEPALLPGPSEETKRACNKALKQIQDARGDVNNFGSMLTELRRRSTGGEPPSQDDAGVMGAYWGKRLLNETPDPWKVLALLWVQTLLYAAPYGDAQAHMQRLSQGGEFITHLWALLYHLGIDKWEVEAEEGPSSWRSVS